MNSNKSVTAVFVLKQCVRGDVNWGPGNGLPNANFGGGKNAWTLHFVYKAINPNPCAINDVQIKIEIWDKKLGDDQLITTLFITNPNFTGAQSSWDSSVISKEKNKPKNWYFKAVIVDYNGNPISEVKTDNIS